MLGKMSRGCEYQGNSGLAPGDTSLWDWQVHFASKGTAVPLVLQKRPDPAVKPWGMHGPEVAQIMGEELEK